MTAALDALARLDDGDPLLPGDRALAEVFDRHAQWGTQKFCLVCGGPNGPECDACVIAHDVLMRRADDL